MATAKIVTKQTTIGGVDIENKYLTYDNRAFLESKNINVFPCSRRGQTSPSSNSVTFYDPEARLNTEHTNRLHTALNGFKSDFIIEYPDLETKYSLAFVLAGYYVEIAYFNPDEIATNVLGVTDNTSDTTLYAHLGLHTGVSLQVDRTKDNPYTTEILYRQATGADASIYLDVRHKDETLAKAEPLESDFFVGISFVTDENNAAYTDNRIISLTLPIAIKKAGTTTWQFMQTSLLPKVDHGTTENSVKVGELTVDENITAKKDLVVDNNVRIQGSTHIKTGLVVGDSEEVATEGLIKATQTVTAPKVEATTELTVHNNDNNAAANLDNATVYGELRVQNDDDDAKLFADYIEATDAKVTKVLESTDLIKADKIGNSTNPVTSITATTANIATLNGDDIQQKIDGNYYDVPVIFLKPKTDGEKTFYQLQISRVNNKT